MEGLRERQLPFDEKNFTKNAHTVFYNISLRACVPNATLNRNLLVGNWQVIFYCNLFKSAATFFLIRNWVLTRKKQNYGTAHKMVEKSGKSWFLLICQIHLVTLLLNDGIVAHSFTCESFPGSTLSICLIATKYIYG